jgi:hypothetical protein
MSSFSIDESKEKYPETNLKEENGAWGNILTIEGPIGGYHYKS